MKKIFIVSIVLFSLSHIACAKNKTSQKKPNVVLIMVDDMGYSDIGCFGSEIPTPNIDKLAENGLRFTQFYNAARCCPTRASLMTGLFPHQTGIGQMTNSPKGDTYKSWGTEGYIGYLNRNCVTVAEVLKENGYHTYMTGKWHLGYHHKDRWPMQRGFEKFYGSIAGATSFFKPQGNRPVTLMNEHQPVPGDGYYTTDAFTDYAIKFIEETDDEKPYFLYLAYTAPHWPLHAKEEDIKKFVGKYMHGWDKVRENRLAKQKELGIFDESMTLSERDKRVRPWSEVDEEQKVRSDYRMAVYAAMVHCVDYNVGRVIDLLKERGELENTLILFLSDNGGCAEMYDEFGTKPDSFINKADFSGAVSYGIGWANASNTPFRDYKVKSYEGGISTPLIAHWPSAITNQKGKITNQPNYLIDVMPTILEVTGAQYPETFHSGNKIHPLEGNSMVPTLKGKNTKQHEYMFWEHQTYCAIRYKNWKAYKSLKDNIWELYDINKDRIEQNNVADKHPELVQQLDKEWNEWANSHKVFPKKVKN